MKVIHLNKNDIHSGSGRASFRIHKSLKKLGVDSRMYVLRKFGLDGDIKVVPASPFGKILKKLRIYSEKQILSRYADRENKIFSISSKGINITKEKIVRDSDIINLHWINRGFLSLKSIEEISKLKKPIFWTLHDMWAFTGGCHYSGNCERYRERCGECPILGSNKLRDLSWEILSRKIKIFKELNLTIITPSKWLADCAQNSFLFRDSTVKVIPNPIDTKVFKPVGGKGAREILNLSKDKHLVLFGISSKAESKRKGLGYLIEALLILSRNFPSLSENIELLVFGVPYLEKIVNIPFKTHFLGPLYDEFTIILCYNAASIFVLPSIEDNLPNTLIESLACGTPVVGFNTGGISDALSHKENGYIVEFKRVEDLARGIGWLLEDKKRLKNLGEKAREKALQEYSYEIVGKKYLKVYENLFEK